MPNKVYVTWEEVEDFVEFVATSFNEEFTGVYGLPRGGLTIAVMLSHRLNIPLLMSPVKHCLIVDDICDSGESLLHYMRNTSNPDKAKDYITATIFYKKNKLGIIPDLYYKYKEDMWIVFPWEYDEDRLKKED